jgi:hypothetical protein
MDLVTAKFLGGEEETWCAVSLSFGDPWVSVTTEIEMVHIYGPSTEYITVAEMEE